MRPLAAALLKLFPRAFRRTLGADLLAAFEDRWRECLSWHSRVHLIADVAWAGLLERLARSRRRLGLASRGQTGKGDGMISTLWQDLRFSIRALVKNAGFSIVVLLTLTLGMGVNTAIYGLVRAVLLNPLPYRDADRIMSIGEADDLEQTEPSTSGYLTIEDWKRRTHSFEDIVPYRDFSGTLTGLAGARQAEHVEGARIGRGFLKMLGVQPVIGRDFLDSEDTPARRHVVLLSYGFWQRTFGGGRNILGRAISLSGTKFEIVGVLPPSFHPVLSPGPPVRLDVWSPLGYDATLPWACRDCEHLQTVGKLRRGVTKERALAELNAVHRQLIQEYPASYPKNSRVVLMPMLDRLVGSKVSLGLWIVLGAVSTLLLIACANVSNLALSRTTGRKKEVAIRFALGASRTRMAQLLLTESMALSVTAASLGIVAGQWTLRTLVALAPSQIPRIEEVVIDWNVLLFALAVSIMVGASFGMAPVLLASHLNANDAMKETARTASGGGRRTRSLLITSQVALAFLLVSSGALLLRSFLAIEQVSPGLDVRNVLSMRVSTFGTNDASDEAIARFTNLMLERLKSLPGVESAAVVSNLALRDSDRYGFQVRDKPKPAAEAPSADRFVASVDYFRIFRIPLKAGRLFNDRDDLRASLVAIIGETTERSIWPGESALGKKIQLGGLDPKKPWITVIGVVGDVRPHGLEEAPELQVYIPAAQAPLDYPTLLIRATTTRNTLAREVQSALAQLDRTAAVFDSAPMEDQLDSSLAARRFSVFLITIFGVVGLLLATIGVYSVVSYAAVQRTREIGIRIALGASRTQVVRMILSNSISLVLGGIGVGLVLWLIAGGFLQRLVFGIKPYDPITACTVALSLIVFAAIAGLVPAARAIALDPNEVLRSE